MEMLEEATLTPAHPAAKAVGRANEQHPEAEAMISELKIRNFKSLESVDLKLGHFNLLVGANASGKSNFLDALRFVQGVGNRFNIGEILDGKPRTDTRVLWGGIRGGSKFVAFRKLDGQQAKRTDFDVSFQDDEIIGSFGEPLRYKVCFSASADAPYVVEDSLSLQNPDVATTLHVNYTSGSEETSTRVHQEKSPPSGLSKFRFADRDHGPFPSVLNGYIPKKLIDGSNEFFDLEHAADNLSSMQFLDPLPAVLRDYSSKVWRLGEDGEGFAALIHEIESNGSKPALLEWLKELRPDEVSDLFAIRGAVNDYMAAIKEGNTVFPAPAISDGTLRFIALAAAFFQPSMPKILVIEEIEKGLHPSRLRLLLELMRSQSKRTGTQVFATTHSPTLLAWLTEEDRKTTFVCTRDAESGATKMRSLAKIPRFEELLEEGSHIDELFAEGWLESAPQ
jgi:predicted ATPase